MEENKHYAVEITDSNFEELLKSEQPIVIDFWAQWCGPCRLVGPTIEEFAKANDGEAIVGKVDVDTNPQIAQKYGIRSIPTILFIQNGEVKDKCVGAVGISTLSGKLESMNTTKSE